ncbi:serine/threonine-protein phosphatase [candidate division KSB1 bacterium]|nr:serine/threonine-protein phosphatase [candidate division KSB1 bacterium]
MAKYNSHQKKSPNENPKIGKTILNDIREENIPRSLIQEFKDIYHFYIDLESKKKLAEMGRIRRWFRVGWWILKSMFFKLTPVRRILFLLGIILTFASNNNDTDNKCLFGVAVIIIVLMLELKDKLLARDELMVGRAVQMSLLPEENPNIPGWDVWIYSRPANEVGGDLVDYMKLSEEKWGLALGDVAGKGLGAALLMAKLQATLRAIAPNFLSLSKLGEELNKIFCRDGIPARFISLAFLELISDSGKVKFLNAGHMPPLLVSKTRITELSHGEAALGIKDNVSYKEHSIELQQDDLLMLYSDGVTEARNRKNEFFGESRLMNLLSKNSHQLSAEIGKKILAAVKSFIGNERASDDLSMVLLRRGK